VTTTDAAEAVRRLGGTARWADLSRYTTQHSVRRALDRGALTRPARGVYALADLPAPAVAAARMGGALSHLSAAQHWGLELLHPSNAIHVTVPRHARPQRQPGVVVHYSDLPEVDGATSPERTVLDCAGALPFAEALAVADSALRRALVTQDQLEKAAADWTGPGRTRRLRVTGHADARAANPFESGLRAVVIDAGLTGFVPQCPVTIGPTTYWVDLGDPERKFALEADSFAFHGTREALARDCRRYDELVAAGWRVLRFAWEHVMFEGDWVAQMVRETWRRS
jgi:very-short-patch-repair endonuclease